MWKAVVVLTVVGAVGKHYYFRRHYYKEASVHDEATMAKVTSYIRACYWFLHLGLH